MATDIQAKLRTRASAPYMVDCGVGWNDLLKKAHAILLAANPDYLVYQVKEKFGGLRFYHGEAAVYDEINEIERMSYEVCEVCGKKGSLDESEYWLRTLCDQHKKERRDANK